MGRTQKNWGFLTLDEVAEILRIGTRTAHELARMGRLGGAKIGGSWRILKDEFDQWLRDAPAGRPGA